ncbi:response regulator [Sulfurospirillum sp. 1612]|uniref:response regulator n=1 Tax=Sulfurospirillum sp. 1612 TaxID=3094835 RepID=UPI002F9344C1
MKFKMQNTLKIIGIYPIIILFIFSSYFLYISYVEYNKAVLFENKLVSEKVLGTLSQDIAKERGLSSTFIASNGHIAKEALMQQRLNVNKSIKRFYNYYKTQKTNTNIKQIITLLNQITEVRARVDSLKDINFNRIFFSYYSQINTYILKEIGSIRDIVTNSQIVSLATSLVNLFNDIEYNGQERGFIAKIISQYVPFTDEDTKIWLNISSRTHTFNYQTIEDPVSKMRIGSLYNSRQDKKILEDVLDAKKDVVLAAQSGEYLIDPTLWFSLMTKKIQLMERSSQIIQTSLVSAIKNYKNQNIGQLISAGSTWFISIIFLIMGLVLSKQFKNNILGLQSIFKKVEELAETKQDVDFSTSEGMNSAYKIIDQAVENIAKEKDNAKEASAAKSIFLANMSHEIRTPLNGIIGFTELLKNNELDDESKEFVEVIEKSSENLLEIINNILDLSKVESNKVEIDEILFSPIQEFENAIEVYGPKASEKGIHLSSYIDPSLSTYIKGDSTKIKEVLINLMSNAVKFTPQDGYITTEVKRVDDESTPSDKVKITFSVQDTGIGIEKDKIKDIFNAFSQADSTITRKFGGTGLGLTISSKYIELMGGTLALESEYGKGTKFYFTLEFDKSTSSDTNYENAFREYHCAILSSTDSPKPHSQFIYNYFSFFGSRVNFYSNFSQLKDLIYKSNSNIIVADYSDLSEEEIEEYKKIKLPIIIVLKSSQQSKFEKLKSKYITPVYEPINMTKIVKILESSKEMLPVKETPQEKVPSHPNTQTFGTKFDANVLVAEDNEINQKLIKRTLEDLGLKITIAENGLRALELRKEHDYDLVFMDIAMPIMDGVIATQEIIKYEEEANLPHIPIIAITANALKGDRERFMNEGLDEYITKPIKKESILSVLNMFIKDKIDYTTEETTKESKTATKEVESDRPKLAVEDVDETVEASHDTEEKLEVEEPTTSDPKIMIFKKSIIESKIFATIITKMGYDTDTAKSADDFKEKIKGNLYNIIILDKEIGDLDFENLRALLTETNTDYASSHTKLILFADSATIIPEEIKSVYDSIEANSINKVELEKLIQENL